MTTTEVPTPESSSSGAPQTLANRLGKLDTRSRVKAVLTIAFAAFCLFVVPSIFDLYYIDALTQVVVYTVVALGLGLLVGRVGMVSFGQAAVLAMGAWVAARVLFATSLPYPIVLLIAGLVTMVLGTLVGLPALRMRGLYLALITLMLAGAITVVLATTNFPNGGSGFLGYNGNSIKTPPIRRPSIATSDPAFLRYAIVIAILMFLLAVWHLRSRPGRAWAAIRQSEASALAAGINIVRYKLWAFALASFITGVAGGLLAGADKYLYSIDFPTQGSISLLAVVLMGGVYSIWGAVAAGLFMQLLPAILNNIGVSPDWLSVLFGVGVLQVLTTAPGGVVDQMPKDLAKLGRLIMRLVTPAKPAGPTAGDAK